jgi:large subunit ribosomal protein L9
VAGGFTIDKKRIHLHTPVKTLGKHTVKVKLHADVSVELGFDVVSENPIDVAAPVEVKPAAKGGAKSDKK